jgi:hypothetical protein
MLNQRHEESAQENHDKTDTDTVTFRDGEFMQTIQDLYVRFPNEWVAMEIGERDEQTGLRKGQIIAHHRVPQLAFEMLRTFQPKQEKPVIRVFSTRLALM